MNKVFGKKTDFAPIREDASRVIISYDYAEMDEENATWLEVYLYKKQISSLSFSDVKDAIIADINARTDSSILDGFVWNGMPVWLSIENQGNIAAAEHRAATTGDNLPLRIKIGEDEDGSPVYHEFPSADELTTFWNACQDYIQWCRKQGWQQKDGIDWTPYEKMLKPANDN